MKQGVLGLAVHPTQPLLYAGFVQQDRLGVYRYDSETGALALQGVAANSGKALCWIVVNADGRWLYTSNTGDNSISYYNLANPQAPVETQMLALKEPGPLFRTPMGMMLPTSESFQLALSPDETRLYVVSQHGYPDFSAPNGNVLHTLAVAPDGSLSAEGEMPELAGATAWINSPLLDRASLRRKVVLVEFWTFGC